MNRYTGYCPGRRYTEGLTFGAVTERINKVFPFKFYYIDMAMFGEYNPTVVTRDSSVGNRGPSNHGSFARNPANVSMSIT